LENAIFFVSQSALPSGGIGRLRMHLIGDGIVKVKL
jgi:hypothetical protein